MPLIGRTDATAPVVHVTRTTKGLQTRICFSKRALLNAHAQTTKRVVLDHDPKKKTLLFRFRVHKGEPSYALFHEGVAGRTKALTTAVTSTLIPFLKPGHYTPTADKLALTIRYDETGR